MPQIFQSPFPHVPLVRNGTLVRKLAGLCAALACVAGGVHAQGLALDRPMGEATARAMLSRFGFGPTRASLAAAASQSPREYLRAGIVGISRLPPAIAQAVAALPAARPVDETWALLGAGGSDRLAMKDDPARRQDLMRAEREHARSAVEMRLLAMANGDNPAHESLLWFWLNHFSVFAPKGLVRIVATDYARAIGAAMPDDRFESLLRASFFHPAMQVYLDNAQSTAPDSPAARFAADRGRQLGLNENLARELLELHTLGVDAGYSQHDVQELARILTGAGVWNPRMNDRALEAAGAVRKGIFLFDPRRHDFGPKRLLGQDFPAGQGLEEIDRALRLLATHPATARHLSRKLALRYVSDAPSEALVGAMAQAFLRSGGRISATLETILASAEFGKSLAARAKFREPLDQILFTARVVCDAVPVGNGMLLTASAVDHGQAPFMRTTPDGYGARETDWLSPAATAKRVRMALGVAGERVPLKRAEADAAPASLRNADTERARFLRGEACSPDPAFVESALGPLAPATVAALEGLGARDRLAALLASPEAWRR